MKLVLAPPLVARPAEGIRRATYGARLTRLLETLVESMFWNASTLVW